MELYFHSLFFFMAWCLIKQEMCLHGMVLVKHSDNFTLPLFHSKYCSHVTNYKHDDRVKI